MESAIGFRHQFSSCLEIHLSVPDLSVTEVGAQQWKARRDVGPFAVPEEQTGNCEGVTEVMF